MLIFPNLLITHVHIEASMAGARAKVTEVMGKWFPLKFAFTKVELREDGHSRHAQELSARQDEARSNSLLTFHSRRFKLVAFLPADKARGASCLPAESEAEARHRRIADKVHLWMVFIARLMVMLFCIFLILLHSPGFIVAFKLDPFVDRERWNPHASQTEMVRAIVVSGL